MSVFARWSDLYKVSGLCHRTHCNIRYQPVKVPLREPVDGEPDVELDLGLPGHCHQLGVEEELDPGLLDVVDESLVGCVGVGGHRHQQLVAPQHRRPEKQIDFDK